MGCVARFLAAPGRTGADGAAPSSKRSITLSEVVFSILASSLAAVGVLQAAEPAPEALTVGPVLETTSSRAAPVDEISFDARFPSEGPYTFCVAARSDGSTDVTVRLTLDGDTLLRTSSPTSAWSSLTISCDVSRGIHSVTARVENASGPVSGRTFVHHLASVTVIPPEEGTPVLLVEDRRIRRSSFFSAEEEKKTTDAGSSLGPPPPAPVVSNAVDIARTAAKEEPTNPAVKAAEPPPGDRTDRLDYDLPVGR